MRRQKYQLQLAFRKKEQPAPIVQIPEKKNPATQSKRQFISDFLILTGAILELQLLQKPGTMDGKLIPNKKEYPCSPPWISEPQTFQQRLYSLSIYVSAHVQMMR